MITLKLSWPHYDPKIHDVVERNQAMNLRYQVNQVVGSVDYVPGQLLSRDQVKGMCDMTGMFKIIIDQRRD